MEFFHIFRYFWSRRSRFLSVPLTLLACNFPLSLTAQAGSVANSTVDKIKQTKTITIGHRTDGVPFSYVTADGTVAGYSIDICKEVAEYIRDALKLDRIKVDYAVATPGTRFVLVKSGKVDMECAATTNNAERRKQVAFSYPHFYSATRFVAKKASGFNTIQDLAGRSVASTTGTINIEQLQDVNRTHNLNISVLIAKVDSEGFAMVKNNRASAFVMDDVLLAGQVAFSDAPEEYAISQDKFGPAEPYGIMLPKDDVAFKTLVNQALYKIYTSGEINSIYDKWFMSPVPPMNRNFNLPISEELRAEFKNPAEYDQ